MIAHIGGIPLEETLPQVAGASAGLVLLARAWVVRHVRLRRASRT